MEIVILSNKQGKQFGLQTAQEKRASESNFIVSIINSIIGASWLAALSKLSSVLSKFFADNKQYFFFGGQILSLASFVIYTIEYAGAANKNASKTGSLLYRLGLLLFAVATALVMMLISASMGTILLGIGLFIDPLVNLGKGIFYAVRWSQAHRQGNNAHSRVYKINCLKSFAFFAGGLLVALGFVALYMFPLLPLAGTAAIGVIGGLIAVVPYLIMGIKRIVDYVKGRQPQSQRDELSTGQSHSELLARVPVKVEAQHFDWSKKGYYAYMTTHEHTDLAALKEDVVQLRQIIENRETKKFFLEKHFFPDQAEHPEKVQALECLEQFIDFLENNQLPASATKTKPFVFNNQSFYYQNIDQFIAKFDRYITSAFSGAYQSAGRKVGRVQACFNQVYAYLQNEGAPSLRMSP